jgi:hypothetical protein
VADSDGPKKSASRGFPGHERRGKRYVPPMRNFPIPTTIREFRKQALPDFLWLLTMLQKRPLSEGAGPTGRALDLGQAAYSRAHARGALDGATEPVFHGLLTDWERVPEQERAELLRDFRRLRIYNAVVPAGFAHALAAYADAPGRWLIEPRYAAGLVPSASKAERHLWELVRLGGRAQQPLATNAMFLWLRGLIMARRIHFPPHPVFTDILPRYPNGVNDGERAVAETTLRAMFLAAFYQRDGSPETLAWCQRFWRANLALFECGVKRRDPPDPPDREKVKIGTARCLRLQERFLTAVGDSDPDLWDSDRYDVLTGMTWRVLRIAGHLISHPAQWSEEHGYPAIRSMFEALVQMRWMLSVEATRPTVWFEFKDYGRGKSKQLKLNTEQSIAKLTGEPKEILERLLPKLTEEANRDGSEEFQDISTAGTFIDDKSLFTMADEVGMGDMYQSTLVPASSSLHGDWSALDDLYLDRCLHPLHGPHALPRIEPAQESDERLPFIAEKFSTWALDWYLKAIDYVARTDASQEATE